jgi:hypothetical protein
MDPIACLASGAIEAAVIEEERWCEAVDGATTTVGLSKYVYVEPRDASAHGQGRRADP